MKNYQTKLFPYAYNILGSSEDAKDVIQDVLLKFLSIEEKQIENKVGYLVKSVINQSINLKKKKDKTATGTINLPEPVSTENADTAINKKEILSYSMLVLLEKLSAKERAVFILKEAFDFSHKDIAVIIGQSTENSRKLLSRAKVKLTSQDIKRNKAHKPNNSFLTTYVELIKNRDLKHLEKLLSKDILLAADGGKNIKVIRELTTGRCETAKLILTVYEAFLKDLEIKISTINHQPAILFYKHKTLYNCQIFELEQEKIKNIYSVVDPQKLSNLNP